MKRTDNEMGENVVFTNFRVKGIPNDTYRNPAYLGLINNPDNSLNEVYVAQKGDQEVYVVVGTRKPIEEYPRVDFHLKRKKTGESELLFGFVPVERAIKAEIPRDSSNDDIDHSVWSILCQKDKTLEEKIDIISSEDSGKTYVKSIPPMK